MARFSGMVEVAFKGALMWAGCLRIIGALFLDGLF